MRESKYLYWMSENTDTQWCNDSAKVNDLDAALLFGAVGCTSNPPLSFEALTVDAEIYADELAQIPADLYGDDRVVELIGIVIKHLSKRLSWIYAASRGEYGYIRAQVQPNLSGDPIAMLKMGLKMSSWGRNVKVKVPGTDAGVWVLEELAAQGIPTNPTICVTTSQIIAAAEANERGVKRAIAKGIRPAPSTSAIVIGRLQDYLATLNIERQTGLSVDDLEKATLAVAKRCYYMFAERGYQQVLMPAAFRSAKQVEQLVGSKVIMTISPKIQDEIIRADMEGSICREVLIDNQVDSKAIERAKKALPEFELAYEPGALVSKDFDTFGGTVMTLRGFDANGWQKLRTL